jgi:hypothetical protein
MLELLSLLSLWETRQESPNSQFPSFSKAMQTSVPLLPQRAPALPLSPKLRAANTVAAVEEAAGASTIASSLLECIALAIIDSTFVAVVGDSILSTFEGRLAHVLLLIELLQGLLHGGVLLEALLNREFGMLWEA